MAQMNPLIANSQLLETTKSRFSGILTNVERIFSGVTSFIRGNPIVPATAVGLGTGLVAGTLVGASRKSSTKKRKSRKVRSKSRVKRRKKKGKKRRSKGRRTPRTAGKGKDRSTRRIRYTKKGQPYVIMKSGKARFIKKSGARRSHKMKGGRY